MNYKMEGNEILEDIVRYTPQKTVFRISGKENIASKRMGWKNKALDLEIRVESVTPVNLISSIETNSSTLDYETLAKNVLESFCLKNNYMVANVKESYLNSQILVQEKNN